MAEPTYFCPHCFAELPRNTASKIERKQANGSFTETSNVPLLIQDNDTAGVYITESFAVSDLNENGTLWLIALKKIFRF